jgi:hypothetical protein
MRFFADPLMVFGNTDGIAERFGARHCDFDFVQIVALSLLKLECEQIVDFGE